MPFEPAVANDVFTEKELSTILKAYGDKVPEGKFLKDRYGFTHYSIKGSLDNPMVVVCHGLGTSMKAFTIVAEDLVKAGYSVLKYDYYGHGYSKYGNGNGNGTKDSTCDLFFDYTPDMFVDQLEDLIDHVKKEEGGKDPFVLCGHSTGGIVCTTANHRWSQTTSTRTVLPKIVLIAPAYYGNKPFTAKLVDALPTTFTFLNKFIPPIRYIIGSGYLDAIDASFAKEPNTGIFIHKSPEDNTRFARDVKFSRDTVLFGEGFLRRGEHPFLAGAVFSIVVHTLRDKFLPGYRNVFEGILKDKNTRTELLWLWGTLDDTVPFKNATEAEELAGVYNTLTFEPMVRLGHEATYEKPNVISQKMIEFMKSPETN